jgi:hypothetical protein
MGIKLATRLVRRIAVLGLLLLVPAIARADAFTFTLLPVGGLISGGPGSIVGWGYQIENLDSANWLVTTGLTVDSFEHASPTLLFDFPIVAPLQTVTVAFDGINGLYELLLDSSVGFTQTGQFTLSAQWYDGDPFSGGNYVADADDTSADYSVTIAETSAVPEPSSLLLVLSGLACLGAAKISSRSHPIG